MINNYNINFGLDILFHVFILFTFLTIFFFSYVSSLEKQNLTELTTNIINNDTNVTMNKLNELSSKFNYNINWKSLDTIASNLIESSKKNIPEIEQNNEKLFNLSIIIFSVLFIFIILLILYLKFFTSFDIHLRHILITNLIIFSITGLVEYIFFAYVASKYTPIMPDTISNTILDRLKTNINKT